MATPPTASKILIIRHAEKPGPGGDPRGVMPDGSHSPDALTVRGWQRAGGIVSLFAPARGPLQDPDLATPGTIIASWTSATRGSQRPLQTVSILAKRLKIEPTTFEKGKVHDATEAALGASGTALISWQHEEIPTIAAEIARKSGLPIDPEPPSTWPGDRFDLVWVFDRGDTAWSFRQVPQLLLPGDADTPI